MSVYRDPQKLIEYLTEWIKEQFRAAGAKGAVLGISGGIDSAVLAGLLSRSLGKENVIGVIMPCHSQPIDEEYAIELADALGIRKYKVDLTKSYDQMVSSIKEEGLDLGALPSANIKPRLRMTTLYAIAQQNGYLVCGGGNRDEILYGYFTKYGDSGVDLLPMSDLLKGEVRALAIHLGVPPNIIKRPPTAGLWAGQTDESEMGLTYEELDNYLATGKAEDRVKQKVDNAIARSEHKRKFAPMASIPEDIK
ncbi:MAG: NAD(+) synthase [Synergistaceae bacterium]|nr:NAD(+) synthase [Synergistaceae bacterium]MCK9435861.1 NAD(+) synthase [Synergistaceae bacterium]MDD2349862.1 NAD(+) synthase [Synergistaceae bacterium]MDD3318387.1 NAD(+) synthase [Synergistaceae bacterium]MDD3671951.1 NAD(+) synthase [Synergistaceae bacterium]